MTDSRSGWARARLAVACVGAVVLPWAYLPQAADPFCTPRMWIARIMLGLLVVLHVFEPHPDGSRTRTVALPGLALPMGMVVLAGVIGAAASISPAVSVFGEPDFYYGLLNLTVACGLAWVVWVSLGPARLEKFLLWSSLGVALVAGYGLSQRLGAPFLNAALGSPMFDPGRVDSTFGNPAPLSMLMVLWWPVVVVVALRQKGRAAASSYLLAGLSGLIVLNVVAASSRAAMIVLAVEAVGIMILVGRGLVRQRMLAGTLIMVAVLAVVANVGLATPGAVGLGERLSSVAHLSSFQGRTVMWRTTLPMIARRPLAGFGPGSFKFAYYAWFYPVDFFRIAERLNVTAPHNFFLQVAAENGAVGLLAWVWLAAALAGGLGQGVRRRTWSSKIGSAAALGVLGALAVSMTTMFEVSSLYLTFIMLGAAGGLLWPETREVALPRAAMWMAGAAAALLVAGATGYAASDIAYRSGWEAERAGLPIALDRYTMAERLFPWDTRTHDAAGKRYAAAALAARDRKELSRAFSEYASAQRLNPWDPETPLLTGETYYYAGQVFGSATYYERARKVFRAVITERRSDRAYGWLMLGRCEEGLGRQDAALDAYRRSASIAPDYAEPYLAMASLYKVLGRERRAREALNRAKAIQEEQTGAPGGN